MMKLRTDVQCMLMSWDLDESCCLTIPYLSCFFVYTEGRTEDRNAWSFLWFLNYEMKEYKKKRQFESFSDYLIRKYPSKEKIFTEE